MINPFQNIAVNLRATGPAAVLIAWIVGVTALGLFGTRDSLAGGALSLLAVGGGMILIGLAAKA